MNILLTQDDVVKIGDFGVAKIINIANNQQKPCLLVKDYEKLK